MRWLIFIFLVLPLIVTAQFTDDFSDGDFSSDPEWNGDTGQFTVNPAFQLQLNSSGDGISELHTINGQANETEWRFWIKLSFSPSANNFARVYLMSDQPVLKNDLNGYFVQFGEAGSSDAIELFRQNGQIITSVCRGTEASIVSSFEVRVKVTRKTNGLWTLFTDYTGGDNYQQEAAGTDNQLTSSAFSGAYCKYTGSNSTKFFFDDFYTGPIIVDQQPPTVASVIALSPNHVRIGFSEGVEEISSENLQNYVINQGIGYPDSAIRSDNSPNIVNLHFSNPLQSGVLYSLTVRDIKDFAQNVMQMESFSLSYYTGQSYDIVINEVMPDPNPTVGLPDFEYIELYNTTDIPVFISGWSLVTGSTYKTFGEVSIPANGFLMVADEDAEPFFQEFGPFYGFSSLSLANTGASVTLVNALNQTIHSVSYNTEWYHDAAKEEGGWSIEMIDPSNPCGGINNWTASVDFMGGTPGKQNSVFALNPDEVIPELRKITITDESTINLYFSESMDSSSLSIPEHYLIDNGIGNPVSVTASAPEYQKVTLLMPTILLPSREYIISVSEDLTDCAGNHIAGNSSIRFGLPISPERNDLVINEVLFNPKDDSFTGVDFVEIYNRSQKIIDLGNMLVTDFDTINQLIANPKEITSEGYLLFPGDFLVLTENPEIVKNQYFTSNPDGFLKVETLPSMNNDAGNVVLATKGFEIIDRIEYNENMHHPLLSTIDGVSLERVNFDQPSSDANNWHSSASTVGFATPAYENSQYKQIENYDDEIKVEPEIFSPDNDSYNDYLNIHLNFSTPGLMASITIFDASGRLIKNLVKNQMISPESIFVWNGIDNDDEKANTGIYIIFIEVFGLDGKVKSYKKTTVLGSKL